MKDALEKYIIENKNQFDDYTLDETDKLKLWSQISEEISENQGKIIPLWKRSWVRVAASVVLFMGFAYTLYISNADNFQNQMVNQELLEIDSHYGSLLESQVALIKTHPKLSEDDREDFLLLIDDLDDEYNSLKEELEQDIDNQIIIEAIIANYRKKLQLMEDLLKRKYSNENSIDDGELIL